MREREREREREEISEEYIDCLLSSPGNLTCQLDGDGDFRSEECLRILDESGVIVTNPPLSLFRDLFSILSERGKEFVIIGSQNAFTYKEVFPLLMDDRAWTGYGFGDMTFRVPSYSEPRETRYWQDEDGQKWRSLGNICWFTNLDVGRRHEPLNLTSRYDPERYPRYDNYDAIEVSRVKDIPCDYDGIMGVPITFLNRYCPEQFEILGMTDRKDMFGLKTRRYGIEDSPRYNDLNARSVLRTGDGGYRITYARVLIRRRDLRKGVMP